MTNLENCINAIKSVKALHDTLNSTDIIPVDRIISIKNDTTEELFKYIKEYLNSKPEINKKDK